MWCTQGHVVSTARQNTVWYNEQGDYSIVSIFMLRNAKPAADTPAVKANNMLIVDD